MKAESRNFESRKGGKKRQGAGHRQGNSAPTLIKRMKNALPFLAGRF
jgi:hypothetical protein